MAHPDYYAILGVLPSAEDIVIKAAFRALAQRYHPDKYAGDPAEAERKMKEINEAYSVLSDPSKRKAYDSERKGNATESEEAFRSDEADSPPPYDPLKEEWDIAVEHFPDLAELDKRLRTISWRLSYAFKAVLLDRKLFQDRHEIARAMKDEFLKRYFGESEEVRTFAEEIIVDGHRAAARELNKAVAVVGDSAYPGALLSRIRSKFLPDGYRTVSDIAREKEWAFMEPERRLDESRVTVYMLVTFLLLVVLAWLVSPRNT